MPPASRRHSIPYAVHLVAVMWLIFFVDQYFALKLIQYGIIPREFQGLRGIFFAPLLHNGQLHLLSNTVPLLLMGMLLQSYGARVYWYASFIIVVYSGVGVWLFSRPAIVVGASGLVFGYWSFLVAAVFLRRSFRSLLIASLVMFLYGGLLFSVFEVRERISWAGHFWGAVGGLIAAMQLLGRRA